MISKPGVVAVEEGLFLGGVEGQSQSLSAELRHSHSMNRSRPETPLEKENPAYVSKRIYPTSEVR